MWDTGSIFHEKQDGRLCAQHCLNAVLQGSYFSAVDLGELAYRLDEDERQQMAENGIESEEYRQFIQQPSGNMDDTGYFSVQVIERALGLWSLELVPYNSSDQRAWLARENPANVTAYIFHFDNHWFCIRRFADVWFNLNSLLSNPEYMSGLYLTEYLQLMQNDGYSVFIVCGEFPECAADTCPPHIRTNVLIPQDTDDSEDIAKAVELSLMNLNEKKSETSTSISSLDADENALLQSAILMSMECFRSPDTDTDSCPAEPSSSESAEEIRLKRLTFLERSDGKK